MRCLLPNVIIIPINPSLDGIENPSYSFEKAVRLNHPEALKVG
ncbi:hypothetical protein [Flavobacterium weaverense]|nr:hypothetical protein [Flavobacterium weaverense]